MLNFCEKCTINILKLQTKNAVFKRFYQAVSVETQEHRPIISCRRREFDYYYGQRYDRLDEIKLASKGWHHKKSKGDYFILHMAENINTFDDIITFSEMGLSKAITDVLPDLHILKPTVIQSRAIPVVLSKRNTLIAAETGCGKTLSYLLPAFNEILSLKNQKSTQFNTPVCLIMTPSRELAYQVGSVASNLAKALDVTYNIIVGGGTKKKMMNPTFAEIDLLIATPGAISKLVTTNVYKMHEVSHVILDEADTLLDDSFSEKMGHFLKKFHFHYSNENEGTAGVHLTLASATMPTALPEVISEIIVPDSLVRVTTDQLHHILAHVPQRFLRIGSSMKPVQLLQMVKHDHSKRNAVMIFSNKAATCDWISMFLNENGIKCVNLNGDMSLPIRKEKYIEFIRGDCHVISCTDVGSRGLDTTKVKHVINYDFPKFTADYVHRCGRTGRIGSPEHSHITNFISREQEVDLVQKIELAVRKMECIPNVNGNISSIIRNRIIHRQK